MKSRCEKLEDLLATTKIKTEYIHSGKGLIEYFQDGKKVNDHMERFCEFPQSPRFFGVKRVVS